jgi:hypothetical protein
MVPDGPRPPEEVPLRSDTVLRRRPDLVLRLEADGNVIVEADGRSTGCGPLALRMLDEFGRPRSVGEVLERFPVASLDGWRDAADTLIALRRAGALIGGAEVVGAAAAGFSDAGIHIRMLDDVPRTRAFIDALRAVVRPGDVVVDIGTGTGVLALAAAAAGASRVYAIEAGALAEVAERNFGRGPHAGRITLVRGWSTGVELPERADVLVTETIGNDPFGEGITRIVADARRRLLIPGGRIIPRGFVLLATLVTLPDDAVAAYRVDGGRLDRWESDYGVRLDALQDFAARGVVRDDTRLDAVSAYTRASETLTVARVDLAAPETGTRTVAVSFPEVRGRVDAVVFHHVTDVAHGVAPATTDPWADPRSRSDSWRAPVWILGASVEVPRPATVVVRVGIDGGSGVFAVSPPEVTPLRA